jgi:hypothetical protein
MPGTLSALEQRIRSDGLWKTAAYALYRLDDTYRLWRQGILSEMKEAQANLAPEAIGLDKPEFHAHNPTTSYRLFRVLMRRFVHPGADDVFLDYGSGLGSVLLMAATFPFRRVIGVEYSEALATRAAQILGRARPKLHCQAIDIVTADAADYAIPDDVTVIYFFNPFRGETLARVCDRIRQSVVASPRPVRIVYNLPGEFDRHTAGARWLVKRGEAVFPAVTPYVYAFYETRAAS